MNNFIINLIFKNKIPTRKSIGYLSALTSAICNIILFLTKLIFGILVNSISIMADAFNNLSDIGTNIVSFLGFKYSEKPADKDHPFGHGRFEYISAMIISIIIILFSVELLKSSVNRIITPQPIEYRNYVVVLLIISILVKLWMALFNKKLNLKINSQNLNAVFIDSISDVLATSAVLLSFIFSKYTDLSLDGIAGVIVAVFIGYNGISIFINTLNSLVGTQPESALYEEIISFINSFEEIIGVHDLIIHDYGPETKLSSVHVEMSCEYSFNEAHAIIDNIENIVKKRYDMNLLIHVDPIEETCSTTNIVKDIILRIVKRYACIIDLHDFRIVNERGRKVVVFDMVVEGNLSIDEIAKLKENITDDFNSINNNYRLIINIEKENTFIHN